ncbi:MAG: hypothetical protein ACK5MT_22370 [Actinomycetales bacterium]
MNARLPGAHPRPEDLDDLIDDAAPARIGEHVADCDRCTQVVTELRHVRGLLSQAAHDPALGLDPPEDLVHRITTAAARSDAAAPGPGLDTPPDFTDWPPVAWSQAPTVGSAAVADTAVLPTPDGPQGTGPEPGPPGHEGASVTDLTARRPRRRWTAALGVAAGIAAVAVAGTLIVQSQDSATVESAAGDASGALDQSASPSAASSEPDDTGSAGETGPGAAPASTPTEPGDVAGTESGAPAGDSSTPDAGTRSSLASQATDAAGVDNAITSLDTDLGTNLGPLTPATQSDQDARACAGKLVDPASIDQVQAYSSDYEGMPTLVYLVTAPDGSRSAVIVDAGCRTRMDGGFDTVVDVSG